MCTREDVKEVSDILSLAHSRRNNPKMLHTNSRRWPTRKLAATLLLVASIPALVSGWNYEQRSPPDLSPKYLSDIDQRSQTDLALSQLPHCDGELSVCRDRSLGYLLLAAKPNIASKKWRPKRRYNLRGGGDIAVQCANKCATLQRSGNGYIKCVAYAYDYSTHECALYDKIEFDRDWKDALLHRNQMPSQLVESETSVLAVAVPIVRKLGTQKWIESYEVPISKSYLGKIESQYQDCQRCARFGCTFFSFERSDRKCYYYPNDRVNDEEDDDEEHLTMKMKSDYTTFYRLPEMTGASKEEETEMINENNNVERNNPEEVDTSYDVGFEDAQQSKQMSCAEDGFFSNPHDCSKFYRCHAGFRFDFECPSGALYNHLIKTCDHAGNVNCAAQMKASLQSYTPPSCQGLHPHSISHPDCTKFYQCNLGVLFSFDCAPGTHFNVETGMCDYPSVARCVQRQQSAVMQQSNPNQSERYEEPPRSNAPKRTKVNIVEPTKPADHSATKLKPAKIRAPKPRPVQESFVEYDEDKPQRKASSASGPKKADTPPTQKIEPCTPKSKTPCTLANYDWLHLPDMEFEGQPEKSKKSSVVKKVMNPMSSEGMDECHELCLDYNPQQGLSCVAYSYNNDTRKCDLYGEVELDENWLNEIIDQQKSPEGMRKSPGTNSRVQLSEPQVVLRQWLVSPALPFKPKQGSVAPLDFLPVAQNVKIKHFIDCLNACAKQPRCTEFVYNSIDKQCLIKTKSVNNKNSKKTKSKRKPTKTTYKSGWISGHHISDIVNNADDKEEVHKQITKSAFMAQNDGEILDLLEQYQLEKSNEPLISLSTGEHKHLNPIDEIRAKTVEECQERCATYGVEDLEQARRKRDTEDEDQEQLKKCKFITVHRPLQNSRANVTCLLYSDDPIETEMALLGRELSKQASHVSDINSVVGATFGTKPLQNRHERTKRQSRRLIPAREHLRIVSYPKEEVSSVGYLDSFFESVDNTDKSKKNGLVSIGSLMEIPNRDDCLRYCLKQWKEPEAPFSKEIRCQALSLVFNSESSDYTCTFFDRPNSNLPAGTLFFELSQLMNVSRSRNVTKAYRKTTPSAAQLTQVAHYQPLQEFPNVEDYDACLKGCLDQWKSRSDARDRCRLVVINVTSIHESDRIHLKPRFDCAFYDFKVDSTDAKKDDGLRVFHKPKSSQDFEEVPPTLTAQIIDAIEAQTKAFYHHSKAAGAQDCLDTCSNIQNFTNLNKRCNLVAIRRVFQKSQSTQRSIAEFQCAFYENALHINFHDGSEEMHEHDQGAPKAYQAKLTPKGKWVTENLDPESAAVNYATTTFEPIVVVRNTTEPQICAEHCVRMHKNDVADCQIALWKNSECQLFAFNASNIQLEDFDHKQEIKGFTLREKESSLSALLLKFKSVNYTEKFTHIRHLGGFLNPLRGRRAFDMKLVANEDECFENCLQGWTKGAVVKQRRLCRFVTIRNVSDTQLECAMFSHNSTSALQSIRVIAPESITSFKFNKQKDDGIIASWNGSFYRQVNWSLPLPVESSNIRLHKLDHLGDCLAECDQESQGCQAMLAVYSADDEESQAPTRCYTLGDGEFTPDSSAPSNAKMFVKISNVDAEMRQKAVKTSRESRKQNAFMGLIKSVRQYERQQSLADVLNNL